ncbi:MAG: S1 RNA-binding domain-containing protein [Candidatus Diapherotrites archaeon]|nr:S1 RNA-binding domain-containing protein [Candidatus Diapherotrites archaeon]
MVEEPESGEIVVVRVSKVLAYGAFVELIEYDNKPGFVHISQVASRWVKNIRNYVKENETRVAQVLSVDRGKNQIDLSLIKVSQQAARQKLESWKQFKRVKKMVEILAKSQKKTFDEAWKAVAEPLLERHESLFDAFQEIAAKGEIAAEGVPEKWAKPLVELVQKNIKVPFKTLKGILTIKSEAPDAIEKIRKAFREGLPKAKEAKVEAHYKGGGHYEIISTAMDFKTADRDMTAVRDTVIDEIEKSKGKAEFAKEE